MLENEFYDWLLIKYNPNTANARKANCLNVSKYEGDLDQYFEKDACRSLIEKLSYSTDDEKHNRPAKHKIPISGNLKAGSATLKQAVNLYVEFKTGNTTEKPKAEAAVKPETEKPAQTKEVKKEDKKVEPKAAPVPKPEPKPEPKPKTPAKPVENSFSWSIKDGILTIKGNGPMPDYYYDDWSREYVSRDDRPHPWQPMKYSIKKVIIENGITHIGKCAFSRCINLISVEIANSVKTIGTGAFYRCESLNSIQIPNSVQIIQNHAFSRCFALTSIEIPNSVQSIEVSAFISCTALTSAKLPSIQNFDKVFGYCSKLANIEFC